MISNIYATITLWTAIASFVVGGFILIRRFRSPLAKIWFFLCLAIGGWNLGYYFTMIEGISEDLALLSSRISHASGILIAALFFHFALIFLKFISQKRLQLILAYLSCSIIAVLCLTSFVVTDLVPNLFLPYYPVGKIGYVIYVTFFIFWVIYAHYLMLKHYRRLSGYERNQLKYFLIGTILGFSGGATCFPLIFGFPLAPYASSLIFVYPFTTTYAIVKYRLMDITLAWRQVLIFAGYFMVACALPFLPMRFGYEYPISLGVIMAIFLLIAPFLQRFLYKFSQPFVDDVLLGGKYSYWNSMGEFWKKRRVVYTTPQLGDTLVTDIPRLMNLESASFFGLERDREVLVPYAYVGLDDIFDPAQAEIVNTLYPDDPLPLYLEKEKAILFRDDLAAKEGLENKEEIIAQMDEIKAYICAPLFVAGKLTAILNLGRKRGGELFHQQDMDLLKELVVMAENHLSHTVFFENSLFFSGSTAHDIRSPLKSELIDEYLYDISQGLKNPAYRTKAEEALANLGKNIAKFRAMIDRMVNAFEIFKRFVMGEQEPQRINYNKKVNETTQDRRKPFKEKGIELDVALPSKDIFVYADPIDVDRILNELITNAYKYTKKGQVKIEVRQEKPQEILTIVSDTGSGIAEEDLDEIWNLFKRADSNPGNGTGIGLASVRQLVEANGGKIWVESQKDKGSKFFFTLPAKEI